MHAAEPQSGLQYIACESFAKPHAGPYRLLAVTAVAIRIRDARAHGRRPIHQQEQNMSKILLRIVAIWLSITICTTICIKGAEIGFMEDFALSANRAEILKQLIPGSEDHYYFQALHLQQAQQYEQVTQLLPKWIGRYGHTPRVIEIQLRQALLTYEKNPQQSLETIRRHLNLEFNHQRENLGEKPNFPSELDPRLLTRERLMQEAFNRHSNLDGFEASALDWLVTQELDPDRRRNLLQRLQRPDYEALPKLIVDDLGHVNSGGFGSHPIHQQLLLAELETLLKLKPELLNQQNFVNTYITKLAPHADIDWRRDVKERDAYLNRLWSFVSQLAPVHNSLKAHVLYHRLVHDSEQGLYDKERFMAYIRLPRNAGYLAEGFVELEQNRRFVADLNADFAGLTGLRPIGNDEAAVRDYLHHFFIDENTTKPYEPFIQDIYLRHVFAETKIVNGLGNAEQWYALLTPELYRSLQERIDLEFLSTSRRQFGADEPVSVDLWVKNVKSLIVNVFELNTKNYYRQNLRELNTDINLDGLVANEQQTFEYVEPPVRRMRRHFEFPSLTRPGTYVIDFIGNGMSSRVVVQKGSLRHLVRTSTAGHVFTILDDRKQIVRDGTVWLAGHEYSADQDGHVVVPFTDKPGAQNIVLGRAGSPLCSLATFQHGSENYSLAAGIHIDRESLLSRRQAEGIVRPALLLNGVPVTLSVLEEIRLTIVSQDLDGVSTTKEISPFPLFEDRESTFEFHVPPRLASLTVTLRAKVQNLSQNKKVDLSASTAVAVNSIDKSDRVEDLFLAKIDGKYVLELLGKTGEPKADRAVRLQLKHRDFRQPVLVTLKSDETGRVQLGALPDITALTAIGPEETNHTWTLSHDRHSFYQSVHGLVGEPVVIPYMGTELDRSQVSLLELRNGTFFADRFGKLSLKDGLLIAKELAAGDYDLWLKQPDRRISLRVTEGKSTEGYLLGKARHLESRGSKPLQIAEVNPNQDSVKILLKNATKHTRVHVFATRYEPEFNPFTNLGRIVDAEPKVIHPAPVDSLYASGRNIGDEYRYILDRKLAKKFPGVMVERPGLLLNPWAVRTTQTSQQEAQAGSQFAPAVPPPAMADPHAAPGLATAESRTAPLPLTSNFDFLEEAAVVLTNLVPDENGTIEIPREQFGSHQYIHIVAVDPVHTAYRSISLAEKPMKFRDLRLARGLDPQKHFTQQKHTTIVHAGESLELADITTSKLEPFDSLARVYGLYVTLSRDPKLIEFGFVLNWPKLKAEEKRTLYSKYACHELNFFLFKKDRKFFNEVVKPFLANKRDKTFLDRWLLEMSLEEDLDPWAYERLNIAERLLLAQRVAADAEHGKRHVRDLFDLLPPDISRSTLLFETALRGSALETEGESLRLEEALGRLGDLDVRFNKAKGTDSQSREVRAGAGGLKAATPESPPAPSDSPGVAEDRDAAGKDAEKSFGAMRLKRRAGVAGRAEADKKELYFYEDTAGRKLVRQLFQQVDKTQEWAENNYYKLLIEQQNAQLVSVNSFWRDYASFDQAAGKPFFSVNFPDASHNFTEMMFALALLDLPFEAGKHETKYDQQHMSFKAATPLIAFHQEIRPVTDKVERTAILVSQNFFQANDRYRHENNEQLDKFVTEEFLVHTVYGCQVVVTNPTSSPQKLDVLTQIPVGSIPVNGSEATRGANIQLQPFSTQTIEFFFYFPEAGKYPYYPVHISKNEQLVGYAEPITVNAVETRSRIDRDSWEYISQHGTDEQVVTFLRTANLRRLNLDKIAFRMNDGQFFLTVVELLGQRHAYNHTLWSYGIKHDAVSAIREFLKHADSFVNQTGDYLDSRLLKIDPVARHIYQQLEYLPLVNARAHQLGRRREILNDRFAEQYQQLLKILSYKRDMTDEDRLAVAYYLLLQDRIDDATRFFKEVNAEHLATRMQYDYFKAYLSLCHEDVESAKQIAALYSQHPVDRWRNAFRAVAQQIEEAQSETTEVLDSENRSQVQTRLAATEPSLEFQVEAQKVALSYHNLKRVTVNYYLMDIELLFSRNPFVQTQGGQFAHIRPNMTQALDLPEKQTLLTFELPEKLRRSNVLIEISGQGQSKSQPYFANSLAVQVQENYGQLRAVTANPGKPLSKVYVKVYARMKDGNVRFYKDGYTDIRGRFEYASLNTNDLDFVDRFAMLVLSEEHGAIVREAAPPKQ